jgi:hypothetical protein
MDPGTLIALIFGVIAIVGAPIGFFIRHLLNRAAVAEALAEARQETIEELRRQKDRLEITAQIQDRFFSQLPRTLDPGPNQPHFHRGNE